MILSDSDASGPQNTTWETLFLRRKRQFAIFNFLRNQGGGGGRCLVVRGEKIRTVQLLTLCSLKRARRRV